MTDLISENEDGVSVMTYMRSLYPGDWANFLERLAPRLGGVDPASVSEEDFCTGGALSHLQMELQLWASYRGQLLARTVRGVPPLPPRPLLRFGLPAMRVEQHYGRTSILSYSS